MIVGLFVYKAKDVVYVKKYVDRKALVDVGLKITNMVYQEAKEELFRMIPYDFGYPSITTYTEYDIERNRQVTLVEGIPRPKKR